MKKALPMFWLCLLSLAPIVFQACAFGSHPKPVEEVVGPSFDRILCLLIGDGKFSEAQALADSLLSTKIKKDRVVGTYWKAISWLHQEEPDSALKLFKSYRGKWPGELRRVHAEAYLRLAKKMSENHQAELNASLEALDKLNSDKTQLDKIEYLQREMAELRDEVSQLQSERLKYQKLIKDLETIR